ncbi:DUF1904 family protein [Laceyella putida]|uniref:DUF1904 family protein n=1 Tax=Laceyella putida TaxID=110101 RepID=A0ABW2RHT5_9BACL
MPIMRFKGFERERIKTLAPLIIDGMHEVANVPKENVKIELLHVEAITKSPQYVEILMFEREQEQHDAVAAMLHHLLCRHGFEQVHIFFIRLTPSLYYKGGTPLNQIPMAKKPIGTP